MLLERQEKDRFNHEFKSESNMDFDKYMSGAYINKNDAKQPIKNNFLRISDQELKSKASLKENHQNCYSPQ